VKDEGNEARCRMIDDCLQNIRDMPEADPANNIPEGMYILKHFPTGEILPEAFEEGSRIHLEKLTAKMVKSYSVNCPPIAEEWKDFCENIAPQSDDVNEYVKEHPLIIPFKDQLMASVTKLQVTNNVQYSSRSRVSKALPSVQWSRRGAKRQQNDLSSRQASTIIKGPAGISSSCPIDLHIDTCDVQEENDEEEESEEESEVDEYVVVKCPTRGKNMVKWCYIGCRFRDEEDKKIYRIQNVSKYGRDLVYAYSLDGGDIEDVEYSGCDELISEEWSQWLDAPQQISNKKPRYYYEPVIEPLVDTSSSSSVARVLRNRK
jgi:hypothetical protein